MTSIAMFCTRKL